MKHVIKFNRVESTEKSEKESIISGFFSVLPRIRQNKKKYAEGFFGDKIF